MVTHCRRCGGICVSYAMHYCPDEEHLKRQPEPRRLESPEAAPAGEHDENCFLAMGGGGMCNCSLSKGPEAAPAEGVRAALECVEEVGKFLSFNNGTAEEAKRQLEYARGELCSLLAALSRSEAAPKAAEAESLTIPAIDQDERNRLAAEFSKPTKAVVANDERDAMNKAIQEEGLPDDPRLPPFHYLRRQLERMRDWAINASIENLALHDNFTTNSQGDTFMRGYHKGVARTRASESKEIDGMLTNLQQSLDAVAKLFPGPLHMLLVLACILTMGLSACRVDLGIAEIDKSEITCHQYSVYETDSTLVMTKDGEYKCGETDDYEFNWK